MSETVAKNGRVPLKEVRIDVQRIKPAIVKEVEAKLGGSFPDLSKPGRQYGEALWALVYAMGRRIDPELTWEEAGEVDVVLENVPVPPTSASG